MSVVFDNPFELEKAVGRHLGHSDWLEITQERIDLFAEATGDHQWIHVDPERAKAGPYGTTIAHGYLTLALTNQFLPQIVRVDGVSMGINYAVRLTVIIGGSGSPIRRCTPAWHHLRSRP